MPDLYPLIRPVLRRLPPETAHSLTVRALEAGLGPLMINRAARQPDPPVLAQRVWGLNFPNPVGLAAGFDKDARVPDAVGRLGFGFVEIGTVTTRPQPGNPKPRLFRLEEDQAIVNRMGFNSSGLDGAIDRLHRRPHTTIVGVNLGKNRDSGDAVADYAEGIRRAAKVADYLVVNVSSPNTPVSANCSAGQAFKHYWSRCLGGATRAGPECRCWSRLHPISPRRNEKTSRRLRWTPASRG